MIGVLLILGSLVTVAACSFTYLFRAWYVRQVAVAEKTGQNPYQLARDAVDTMAGDFMTAALIYAAFVIVLSVLLIGLACMRPESTRK